MPTDGFAPFVARTCRSAIDAIADISPTAHTTPMAGNLSPLTKLLARWSRQQETALWQMTERKTVGRRIAGFAKSERVEAKFLLLAIAPFTLVMISDQIGWPRGVLWHVWFWLSAIWAICLVVIGFAAKGRALRRSLRRKR